MPTAQAFLQHPATHLAAATALVERLPLESPAGVRCILRTLCYAGSCGPPVSEQLLELLPLLECELAVELLAHLPQLVGDGEAEMQQLLAVCKEVMAADRTLMLPVIGALGQAPLTDALKHDLARLALGALSLAEESDLPTLVRQRCLHALASSCPCGHPPLQKSTRFAQGLTLGAREERPCRLGYRRLAAAARVLAHSR